MENHSFTFRVLEGHSPIEAEEELESHGLKHIFLIEDDATGEILIGGFSSNDFNPNKSILVEKKRAAVDWNEQWSLFAENFTEGKAHIAVGEKTLLLNPGAGFGDLSHPTTYLMLEMMKNHVKSEQVIDIGTGSGILALAALLLDAASAIGIDIDIGAIEHAKENAKLNNLKGVFTKELPEALSPQNIFLMNMIFPEQKEFAPKRLNHLAKLWIISGILKSEKEKYLAETKKWGWKVVSEYERADWLGYIFENEVAK